MTISRIHALTPPQMGSLKNLLLAKKEEMASGTSFTIKNLILSNELPDAPIKGNKTNQSAFTNFFLSRMQPVAKSDQNHDIKVFERLVEFGLKDLNPAQTEEQKTQTGQNLDLILSALHKYAQNNPKADTSTQGPSPSTVHPQQPADTRPPTDPQQPVDTRPPAGPQAHKGVKGLAKMFEESGIIMGAGGPAGGAAGGAGGPAGGVPAGGPGAPPVGPGAPPVGPGGGGKRPRPVRVNTGVPTPATPPTAPPTAPPPAPPGTPPPAPPGTPPPSSPTGILPGAPAPLNPARGRTDSVGSDHGKPIRSSSFHRTEKDVRREEEKNKRLLEKEAPGEQKYFYKHMISSLQLRQGLGSTSEKESTDKRLTDLKIKYAQSKSDLPDAQKSVHKTDLKQPINDKTIQKKWPSINLLYPIAPFSTSSVRETRAASYQAKVFPAPFQPGAPLTHLELATHAHCMKQQLDIIPPLTINPAELAPLEVKQQLNAVSAILHEDPFCNPRSPLSQSYSELVTRQAAEAKLRDQHATKKGKIEKHITKHVNRAFLQSTEEDSSIPQGSARVVSMDMLSNKQASSAAAKERFEYQNSTDQIQLSMLQLQASWTKQATQHTQARQDTVKLIQQNFLQQRLQILRDQPEDIPLIESAIATHLRSCDNLLTQLRSHAASINTSSQPIKEAIKTRVAGIAKLNTKITAYSKGINDLGNLDPKEKEAAEFRATVNAVYQKALNDAGDPK